MKEFLKLINLKKKRMVETPISNKWQSCPVNPFEENNRLRLEKSILSPNIFNVTNLSSTLEKENTNDNSIWNIDQRAILFPADIPTDDKSLIAQYLNDSTINRQANAAVETFWSENKTIIESPAPSSSTSSFYTDKIKKQNFQTINSNKPIKNNESNDLSCKTVAKKSTKSQTSQTELSFPFDLDLNNILDTKKYLINTESLLVKKQKNIDPIRKNLFDFYNEETEISSDNDDYEVKSSNSLDSIYWKQLKEQISSSPKFKFPNLNITEIEVCSTPELTPRRINFESQSGFRFNLTKNLSIIGSTNEESNNQTDNCTNDSMFDNNNNNTSFNLNDIKQSSTDILINSPNLSPIKENSINNLSLVEENPNDNNNNNNDKKIIDMDIDIGGILKASIVQHNSTTNNNNNLNTSRNLDSFSFIGDISNNRKYNREISNTSNTSKDNFSFFADKRYYNREFSSGNDLINTSKPFTVTQVFDNNEITTNQDQDTGYQTGGSSTQFNIMMDITNLQERDNSLKLQQRLTSSLPPPPPQLPMLSKKSLSLNFDSIKTKNSIQFSTFQEKLISSFNKETPNNLPSFVELCPLGSSTPEKSKSSFHLNYSYNNDIDYLSVTNGLNTNTLYKHNSTFNKKNLLNSTSSIENDKNILVKPSDIIELNSSLENSVFNSKLPASEYARTLLERAMKDLNDSKKF